MSDTPRPPPPWLIDGIGRVRSGLGFLRRSLVPANAAVFEITLSGWLMQAMAVGSKLRLFDALDEAPTSADELAKRLGTHPQATYRLLRALASNSILKQRRDGRFALTRLGKALRSDGPGNFAAMIEFVGHPKHREHWSELEHSVRTGETAVAKLRGAPLFEYLDSDPELAAVFNDAMTSVSGIAIEALMPAYDFSDRRLIVDVGGGHGALLGAVLGQARDAKGVLFDLPSVVAGAGPNLDAAGVASRSTVTGGSFFESVPDGGDMYLLKTIIHDWDDDQAVAILRNVRSAIARNGKLGIVELVLPEGTTWHPGMLLDLEMLVHAGGRERTAAEYAELLSRAGFRLTRVVPTAGPMSLVEAVPV